MKKILIKWFGVEWYCRTFHSHVKNNEKKMWYCEKCDLYLKIYLGNIYILFGIPM